jgi:hypothetical protein
VAYATPEDLAEHLKIPGIDPGSNEVLMQRALDAATEAVDAHCHRSFHAADDTPTERLYRSGGHGAGTPYAVWIDDTVEVTEVAASADRTAWTDLGPSTWWLEPLNAASKLRPYDVVYSRQLWPEWVRVTARWGWPSTPKSVIGATLLLAARLYRRRQSPTGIEGQGDFGVVRINRSDPDVATLLAPYRRHGVEFDGA